ncbi:hypothetical protein ASE61_23785 [Bosea sp. Root670]|uniref:hypothetical protein n=1 Tax=Bosea sp. Root670 TaxID=1736583 RepID=UPI00071593DE|nr:hypothetical protein [Bosea sp. Root670]KRE07015.1 hypothetical protein ASE61_23785 [Bosea sp. Root670]
MLCLTEFDMPFSSFSDPADIARAQGALEIAWSRIKRLVIEEEREREQARLVFIIASLAHASYDEEELAERVWERYWQR